MNQQDQIEIIREIIDAIDNDRAVDSGAVVKNPTSVFRCRDLAAREWQALFRNHPQLVGLSGDLPEPGNYITTNYFGTPILATRDAKGRFRAFVNACRHRGAPLGMELRGKQSRFVCGYHAWTYGNDGKLLGVANEKQFGTGKQSCLNLVELPAQEKYGLLYVHPSPDGEVDIDALVGDMAGELASWELEKTRYLADDLIDSKLNWKLAQDIFGENYHVKALHRDTLNRVAYSDVSTYREFGRNHRFVVPVRYVDTLREKPESEWNLLEASVVVYHLFPNVQFVLVNGAVSLSRIYPDPNDPAHSYTQNTYYRTATASAADGEQLTDEKLYESGGACNMEWGESALEELFDTTAEQEDFWMGTHLQRTADSDALDHFVIGRNEHPVEHFHRNYRSALNLPPLEEFRAG